MLKMILFEVSGTVYAIDQELVKQQYQKEDVFSDRAGRAKKVKIRLDGRDIPFYDLPEIFDESASHVKKEHGEMMLIKDADGHMVLMADAIKGIVEIEEESMKSLSPVFGKRACEHFPNVFAKDAIPVLVLHPSRLRDATGESDTEHSTTV